MVNADSMGNHQQTRDYREANQRNGQNDMPGVQRRTEEQDRPLPVRHVQAGWRGVEMLALWMARGRMVQWT